MDTLIKQGYLIPPYHLQDINMRDRDGKEKRVMVFLYTQTEEKEPSEIPREKINREGGSS